MESKTNDGGPLLGLDGQPVDLTAFVLDTERLSLQPIAMKYAETIFLEFTARITRYMMPAPAGRIEETQAFIRSALARMSACEDLVLVILDKATGEFLGCCGLHGAGDPRHPQLGLWVKESAHGNGYGKEAIVALKRWADASLRFDYITYPADRRNGASRRIPEALGGVVFREEFAPKQDGGVLDEVVYKILPES